MLRGRLGGGGGGGGGSSGVVVVVVVVAVVVVAAVAVAVAYAGAAGPWVQRPSRCCGLSPSPSPFLAPSFSLSRPLALPPRSLPSSFPPPCYHAVGRPTVMKKTILKHPDMTEAQVSCTSVKPNPLNRRTCHTRQAILPERAFLACANALSCMCMRICIYPVGFLRHAHRGRTRGAMVRPSVRGRRGRC